MVPSDLDHSCAARKAKGLSGWGCRCLGSVKLLAPSVNATWQLGLEAWAPSARGGGGGRGPRTAPAGSFPAGRPPCSRPTRSWGEPRGAARSDPPRLHPSTLCSPLGRHLTLRGRLMETLEDSATQDRAPDLPALQGCLALPVSGGLRAQMEVASPPGAPRGAASRRGAASPRGPARSGPASGLRGAKRENRAGTWAGEATVPVTTPRK